MPCLTACLSIPEEFRAKAEYALRELSHRAGFGLRVVNARPANLHYTLGPAHDEAECVVIRCNPRLYSPNTVCKAHPRGGHFIWEEAGLASPVETDIIGGAYRLLAMLDESQVRADDRDRMGTFFVDALPANRRATVSLPLVEFHAEALAEAIARQWPEALRSRAHLWEHDKKFAAVLSHDCDHLRLGAPFELAANSIKSVLRGSSEHAALARLGARYFLRPRRDPFTRFGWWQQWESHRSMHSVFYLFVRPRGVPADLNDCKSTVAGFGTDWELLRRMADAGWEFGLHASLNSRKRPSAFNTAREWLQQHIGARITGVRHHYFALDWLRPSASHRMHAEAGFEYDSSIAFRDAPGFRTGTCLPHRAFDPVRNQEIPLWVIPCNLMDGHLLSTTGNGRVDSDTARERGKQLIEAVSRHGGLLVLNWHQESGFNHLTYAGFVDVLDDLVGLCFARSAWMATAQEVCAYWNKRARELDTSTDSLPSTCTLPAYAPRSG